MQLRRLVIGEVGRFPELAKVLNERGPQRAIKALAAVFEQLADRGLLTVDDPLVAASQFNWLVMAAPLNQAMLLGDSAIPKPPALRRHASDSVRVFLAAYGTGTSRRTRGRPQSARTRAPRFGPVIAASEGSPCRTCSTTRIGWRSTPLQGVAARFSAAVGEDEPRTDAGALCSRARGAAR